MILSRVRISGEDEKYDSTGVCNFLTLSLCIAFTRSSFPLSSSPSTKKHSMSHANTHMKVILG